MSLPNLCLCLSCGSAHVLCLIAVCACPQLLEIGVLPNWLIQKLLFVSCDMFRSPNGPLLGDRRATQLWLIQNLCLFPVIFSRSPSGSLLGDRSATQLWLIQNLFLFSVICSRSPSGSLLGDRSATQLWLIQNLFLFPVIFSEAPTVPRARTHCFSYLERSGSGAMRRQIAGAIESKSYI